MLHSNTLLVCPIPAKSGTTGALGYVWTMGKFGRLNYNNKLNFGVPKLGKFINGSISPSVSYGLTVGKVFFFTKNFFVFNSSKIWFVL